MCNLMFFYLLSLVLPPVLVPRHSEYPPGHPMLSAAFPQVQDTTMPHNVTFPPQGFPTPSPSSTALSSNLSVSSGISVPSPSASINSAPNSPFGLSGITLFISFLNIKIVLTKSQFFYKHQSIQVVMCFCKYSEVVIEMRSYNQI